jgi:iron(III) transport system permease protein
MAAGLARWVPLATLGPLLAWMVLLPLALLGVSALTPTGFPPDPGWTLGHFRTVYGAGGFWRYVGNTVSFALGATALALSLGTVLAWLVERTDLPGRGAVRALIVLPMATPPILMAIGWVMLASPRIGFLNDALRVGLGLDSAPFDIYSVWGMIFVEGLSLVPTTYLMLAPAFRNMDPNLEEAALASGASPAQVIRRILLPLLAPSLLAAAAFLLIVGFVVFDVPATIGMPAGIFVLSSRIYYLANDAPGGFPDYGSVSAIAMFLLAMLVVLAVAYQRFTAHASRFVTVTGKGYRVRPTSLGRWRHVAIGGVTLYFLLAVVAPLGILVWSSLMPYQAKVSREALSLVTMANHIEFLANPRALGAARNSIVISVVSATLVAVLALVIAWVAVRSRAVGRRFLDLLAFVPIAIPGVMISVGLIYVYLTVKGLQLYGTIWIIVVAYVTVYLSYGSRAMNGVMLQLSPDLEEAARTCGAGWFATMRRIVGPLTLPAVLAVWIWVVAHCLRELTSALMLQGRDNKTLSALLFDYWAGGQPTKAATVGVWLIVAVLLVVSLWQFLASRRERARAM